MPQWRGLVGICMDPAHIKHNHYCLNGSICSASLEKYHVPSGLKIKKCPQYLKYSNFGYIRKETYRQLGSLQSGQCRRRQHPKDTAQIMRYTGCFVSQVISATPPAHKDHHISVTFVTMSTPVCSEKINK